MTTVYPDTGTMLAGHGATQGRLNLTGTIEEGAFSPAAVLDIDPTDLIAELSTLRARYLGPTPITKGQGEAGFGQGEAAALGLLADLVNAPANPLGFDPSAKAAILADIAKKNEGTSYYDLECVLMPDGTTADEWITAQHALAFPTAAADAETASQAAGSAHQAELRQWWLANPDAARPAGLAQDPYTLELGGPRFTAQLVKIGQNGRGVPHVIDPWQGWFHADPQGSPSNLEIGISLLPVGKGFWVKLWGATDQGFTLRVVDQATGLAHEYVEPHGKTLGLVDAGTFAGG
jgi:hypothetical protein